MGQRKVETVATNIRVRTEEGRPLYLGKPDRYFLLRYRAGGKLHEEGLGWASEGWNLAKAKNELARLKAAAATGDGAVTLRERRAEAQRKREAEENAPTLGKVWEEYEQTLQGRGGYGATKSNARHIAHLFPMKIEDLRTRHIDALRADLERNYQPQTVKHCLALVRQIIRWGAKNGRCEMPPIHMLNFSMPHVDNRVTENLDDEQLAVFLDALNNYPNQRVAASMKFALLTGVRRYAIFHLQWNDIDFHNKTICLRGEHAKNEKTEYIPLTPEVETLLATIERCDNALVFGEKNFQSRAVQSLVNYVKPYLPDGFRPYHGLRHSYASRLATSGVSLFEIQKLLTHGDASMTQRYAHLTNENLRKAASIMGDVVRKAVGDLPLPEEKTHRGSLGIKRARISKFSASRG